MWPLLALTTRASPPEVLAPLSLRAYDRVEVEVRGPPGEAVQLFGGQGGGPTCAGACLDLVDPNLLRSGTFDDRGTWWITFRAPLEVRPGFAVQALVPATGETSRLWLPEILTEVPGGPWAWIDPPRPRPGEALRCVLEGSRPDHHPEVTWSVDGSRFLGASSAEWPGDLVPAGTTRAGEAWQCAARGVGEGTPTARAWPTEAPGGNVLLVLADDLGVDQLAATGAADPATTPHLDHLAAEGVVFTQATVHPLCSPTRAALLTGRHARRTEAGARVTVVGGLWELPLDEWTLPELLGLSGVRSAVAGKWHLAGDSSPSAYDHPRASGFLHHYGSFGNLGVGHEPGPALDYFNYSLVRDGLVDAHSGYATTDSADGARALMRRLPEPWLILLAFNAPHAPHHTPPPELTTTPLPPEPTELDLYRASIEAMDHELGRVLADLPRNTTVFFLGDNGSPPEVVSPPYDPDRAKGSLEQGGVAVPFLVAGHAVRGPPRRSSELVTDLDLVPTLTDLHDRRPTSDVPGLVLDGTSLLPLLLEPAARVARREVYVERFDPNGPGPWFRDDRMVRDARYKLVRMTSGEERLYRLGDDPNEDGPNLLSAPLDDEALAAYSRLQASLSRFGLAVGAD